MKEIANARPEDLEPLIRKAGFFRVKSRRIKEVSQIIIDEFNGVVPDNIDETRHPPGVGTKTANCVLVYGFTKPAIPVDVHVHRISNRIGLVDSHNPEQTEKELEKVVPKKNWIELNDLMVQFGQTICRPISPLHEECPINDSSVTTTGIWERSQLDPIISYYDQMAKVLYSLFMDGSNFY